MTKVVNLKKDDYDVYIGRGSKWGNPYKIGRDGNRNEVIKKYEDYIRNSDLYNQVEELDSKTLGCYCRPKACHGDVLIKIIQEKKILRMLGNECRNNQSSSRGSE